MNVPLRGGRQPGSPRPSAPIHKHSPRPAPPQTVLAKCQPQPRSARPARPSCKPSCPPGRDALAIPRRTHSSAPASAFPTTNPAQTASAITAWPTANLACHSGLADSPAAVAPKPTAFNKTNVFVNGTPLTGGSRPRQDCQGCRKRDSRGNPGGMLRRPPARRIGLPRGSHRLIGHRLRMPSVSHRPALPEAIGDLPQKPSVSDPVAHRPELPEAISKRSGSPSAPHSVSQWQALPVAIGKRLSGRRMPSATLSLTRYGALRRAVPLN